MTDSILMAPEPSPSTPGHAEMARAFARRDPSYDGLFFVAVRTTGIFCRPSCSSRPKRENVEFLPSARACLELGYRPCLRCHPLHEPGAPDWAKALMQRVEFHPDERVSGRDLRKMGVSAERARRWFLAHHGMTFAAWCRRVRLAHAFQRLRQGARVDDAVFDAGYQSHSGFREGIRRMFGASPGKLGRDPSMPRDPLVVSRFPSPLGPLLLGAHDGGLVVLDFLDRGALPSHLRAWSKRTGRPVVPGDHPHLASARAALAAYFQRGADDAWSTVNLAPCGTPFQLRVWTELRRIPHGSTLSYAELAQRLGMPGAHRAVARANALNRLCLVIPCHRVVGSHGELTGYGGGLWRKRWLLEFERRGRCTGFPGSAVLASPSRSRASSGPCGAGSCS